MQDIQIYNKTGEVVRLRMQDMIHPAEVPVKADNWYPVYRLYKYNQLLDEGLFTARYFIVEPGPLLIFEEYDVSILAPGQIRTGRDIRKYLRIFDLKQHQTGRCSQISGGSFHVQQIKSGTLFYSKQYPDRTIDFEIDMDKIAFLPMNQQWKMEPPLL